MADELDKFVLQYVVEQKDALRRLEELQKKIEGTGKKSEESKDKMKDFAADAADGFGQLIPGLDKVGKLIRTISLEFTGAAAGAGALAAGLGAIVVGTKAVADMRERYNRQRGEAMDIGVSSLRLEEYQRKFVKASGGNISREQTTEEIKKISQFASAIFRDPTRTGQEARTARVLGIDVGQPGEHKSVNEILTQLGEKFSRMTESQVQAQAKVLGMNQDFALGLRKQGGSVGSITELSVEEIKNRQQAQSGLEKFNEAFARLKDNFVKAENILGEKLLPPFIKFVEEMADLSDKLPKATGKAADTVGMTLRNMIGMIPGLEDFRAKSGIEKAAKDIKQAPVAAAKAAKDSSDTAKTLKEMVDGEYDKNAEARNLADRQALAINQFAGAVASFANAVDERQAWAAWAGEIGRASGLSGPNIAATTLNKAVASTQYDALFSEAAKKTGVPESLLKRIATVESGMNPNAVSSDGAEGLMQIMPSNKKGLGISNSFDPAQNIQGGATLMKDFLKRSGGDVEKALMMYHGGLDTSQWGPLTRSYPGKVLGMASGTGESRAKINLRSVQSNIAANLGVPVEQLQQGMINRGDVSFRLEQMRRGITNNIYDMQNQLKAVNLPQQTRSKIMMEIRNQQSGLEMLRKYGGQIEETARPGERQITVGEMPIIINVNGASSPAETARELQEMLDTHFKQLVNGTASAVKR